MGSLAVKKQEEVTMEGETDEALLVYMGMREDDPSGAKAAWEEFFKRHKKYLYFICLRQSRKFNLPDPDEVAYDLVSATFCRAYEKAHTYNPLDNGNTEHMRRNVRAWLSKIAVNLFIDEGNQAKEHPKLISLEEIPDEIEEVGTDCDYISPQRRLIDEALNALKDNERMVLLLSFQWYEIGKANQRLPNNVAAGIARTMDTTPENVRQLRKRALDKVKVFIEKQTT